MSDRELYLINPDGTDLKKLNVTGINSLWSPDSSKIVFVQNEKLFLINSDGSNLKDLNFNWQILQWFPDSNKILLLKFMSVKAKEPFPLSESFTTLYSLNINTFELTKLLQGSYNEF